MSPYRENQHIEPYVRVPKRKSHVWGCILYLIAPHLVLGSMVLLAAAWTWSFFDTLYTALGGTLWIASNYLVYRLAQK